VKPAASNRENVAVATLFRCLRRAEYVAIVEELVHEQLHYSNCVIGRKCEEQFCKLLPEEAHRRFVDAMRQRQTDARTIDFVLKLPSSLRALGYATPLSERRRATAISVLDREIDVTLV
jgi:hypothetical protein